MKTSKLNDPVNILVSYAYMSPDVIAILQRNQTDVRFLLDSGAFTAWKKGQKVELDDYCKFLEKLPFTPWRYFTLDVIGDPAATLKNYETMLKRGFKPLPIFTRGEDLSVMEEYYKTSDVVGIGGLVGTPNNKGFVKWVMNKGVKKRKAHWLGFINRDLTFYFRPYMQDSSSWAAGVKYAEIAIYKGGGRWCNGGKRLRKKDFIKRPSDEMFEIFHYYGEDIFRMGRSDQWKNSGKGDNILEIICFKSWALYSRELERNLGTKLFMACAEPGQVEVYINTSLYWRDKLKEAA